MPFRNNRGKAITKCDKWTFDGSLNIEENRAPPELYNFFRWLLLGPKANLLPEKKRKDSTGRIDMLVQSTISQIYTDNQVKDKRPIFFSSHRAQLMPNQVATGEILRQTY